MKLLALIACTSALAIAADAPVPAVELIATTYTKALTRVTEKPKRIGMEFLLACRPVDPEVPKRTYGPHLRFFTHYFRNPLSQQPEGKYPPGSVIVKEKLAAVREGAELKIQAVAGMIKRPAGTLPKSGDWEFFWFADGKLDAANVQGCAGCHSGAKRDYVFTDSPKATR